MMYHLFMFDYQFGRKGYGPGEFEGWLQHFCVSNDGSLLVACDPWKRNVRIIDLLKNEQM